MVKILGANFIFNVIFLFGRLYESSFYLSNKISSFTVDLVVGRHCNWYFYRNGNVRIKIRSKLDSFVICRRYLLQRNGKKNRKYRYQRGGELGWPAVDRFLRKPRDFYCADI